MAKVIVKKAIKKVKRKFPIEILSPENFNRKVLGNTEVINTANLLGKKIKMNLMYLTDKIRNQNITLTFKIDKVESDKATTKVVKYEQVSYYLSRNLKKGCSLIEDSFEVKSKDNVSFKIKPFVVTRNYISLLVKRNLRKEVQKLILEYVSEVDSKTLFQDIVSEKLQISVKSEIKKITQIKTFEFKKLEAESGY